LYARFHYSRKFYTPDLNIEKIFCKQTSSALHLDIPISRCIILTLYHIENKCQIYCVNSILLVHNISIIKNILVITLVTKNNLFLDKQPTNAYSIWYNQTNSWGLKILGTSYKRPWFHCCSMCHNWILLKFSYHRRMICNTENYLWI
jgi:hypothetical protein